MPIVSVIIPVYQAEKYIERCARSLFEQTLHGIEYIFVDDCSPDRSMAILSTIIEEYKVRLDCEQKSVVIKRLEKNSRQAAARTVGIKNATGDYIIHCDSDDWVDADLYEKMYNEAITSKSDISICPICDEYRDFSRIRIWKDNPKTCTDAVKYWYKNCIGMFLWNKLVKRSIIFENNILPFKDVDMWEDNGVMFRVMYYGGGVSYINGSYYHYYRESENAITRDISRHSVDQMINCASLLEDFFEHKTDAEDYKKTCNAIKFLAKINLVTTRFDWLREYRKLFPESNSSIRYIDSKAFSSRGKIRFLFVKYKLAWLFVILYKVFNALSRNN